MSTKDELVVSGCSYIGDYVREQNEYLVKDKKHDIHFVIDGKIYSEKWNYIEPFALKNSRKFNQFHRRKKHFMIDISL